MSIPDDWFLDKNVTTLSSFTEGYTITEYNGDIGTKMVSNLIENHGLATLKEIYEVECVYQQWVFHYTLKVDDPEMVAPGFSEEFRIIEE